MNPHEWVLHCMKEALNSLQVAIMYLDSATIRGGFSNLLPLANELQAKAQEVERLKEKLEKE